MEFGKQETSERHVAKGEGWEWTLLVGPQKKWRGP